MSRLRSLLQDADPLRHEPPRPEADFTRVRAAVLRTRPTERAAPAGRAPLTLLAALLIAAIAGVAAGYQLWQHGTTTLVAAVQFEVRLAEEQPIPGLIVGQVGESGRVIYLHPETVVSNEDVAQSWVSQEGPDRFSVVVEFLQPGAARMRQATTAHLGRPVALLIDGRVVTAPMIRSPIGDSAVLSGNYTQREAQRIANGIARR